MTRLVDLLPPGHGWNLTLVQAINDRGWILGAGSRGGRVEAFVMKPLRP